MRKNDEQWRKIPNYEGTGILVSNTGKVRQNGKDKTTYVDKHGYLRVRVRSFDRQLVVGVHVLVAAAFLPLKPSDRHVIAFGEGGKADCRPSNLSWKTRSQIGFRKTGPTFAKRARFADIREAVNDRGLSVSAAAEEFNVSKVTVYRALREFDNAWREAEAAVHNESRKVPKAKRR